MPLSAVELFQAGSRLEDTTYLRRLFSLYANSTALRGNVVDGVSKLKQQLNGDIVVYASFQLVRPLLEHDLVDELRLLIYPVVLGAGERLFGETSDKKPMRLRDIRTLGGGLVFLTYEPFRDD